MCSRSQQAVGRAQAPCTQGHCLPSPTLPGRPFPPQRVQMSKSLRADRTVSRSRPWHTNHLHHPRWFLCSFLAPPPTPGTSMSLDHLQGIQGCWSSKRGLKVGMTTGEARGGFRHGNKPATRGPQLREAGRPLLPRPSPSRGPLLSIAKLRTALRSHQQAPRIDAWISEAEEGSDPAPWGEAGPRSGHHLAGHQKQCPSHRKDNRSSRL